MKRLLTLSLISAVVIFSSCTKKTVVVKSPTPVKNAHAPGQMKKATGAQSAAPYAPGQTKKAAPSTASTSGSSQAKKGGAPASKSVKSESKKK